MDDSLKMAYNENVENIKAQEAVMKFVGVDNDTIPEKYYKGRKTVTLDGDNMFYKETLTCKIVPSAYEFLFDAESFFQNFKVLGNIKYDEK